MPEFIVYKENKPQRTKNDIENYEKRKENHNELYPSMTRFDQSFYIMEILFIIIF